MRNNFYLSYFFKFFKFEEKIIDVSFATNL